MQISRLFEIVYILMNRSTVTARELAERFEVSPRTIYRDIDTLALAGVPVYTSKGKGGGIHLMEDFVLNKSLLSEKEQGEILSALQGLSALKAEDAGDVLGKLSALFHKSTAQWLEVDFSDWGGGHGDLFSLLKTSILEKRVVEFLYYSAYGEKTLRRIQPTQLCFKHRAWYLKGFCLIKKDMRTFKLTRIREAALTGEPFSQPLPPAGAHVQEESPPVCVVAFQFKIAPEMAYRVLDEFSQEQITPNGDGSYTVNALWPEDPWVYGTFLSYGEYLQVLQPEHAKAVLKEKLQKTLRHYG